MILDSHECLSCGRVCQCRDGEEIGPSFCVCRHEEEPASKLRVDLLPADVLALSLRCRIDAAVSSMPPKSGMRADIEIPIARSILEAVVAALEAK